MYAPAISVGWRCFRWIDRFMRLRSGMICSQNCCTTYFAWQKLYRSKCNVRGGCWPKMKEDEGGLKTETGRGVCGGEMAEMGCCCLCTTFVNCLTLHDASQKLIIKRILKVWYDNPWCMLKNVRVDRQFLRENMNFRFKWLVIFHLERLDRSYTITYYIFLLFK